MEEIGVYPSPGWVLIQAVHEDKKVGTFVFEKVDKEATTKGQVLRIGGSGLTASGSTIDPDTFFGLKEGAYIIHKQYGAHDLDHDGEMYRLVHLENIIAVTTK